MINTHDLRIQIEGLGGDRPTTQSLGLFVCLVQARDRPHCPRKPLKYTDICFCVAGAKVPLWSQVQMAAEGHCIDWDGHPDSGRHSIGFSNNPSDEEPYAFAPYHFDKENMLWWTIINVRCDNTRHLPAHQPPLMCVGRAART
jgi:hypothetical protein